MTEPLKVSLNVLNGAGAACKGQHKFSLRISPALGYTRAERFGSTVVPHKFSRSSHAACCMAARAFSRLRQQVWQKSVVHEEMFHSVLRADESSLGF